MKKLKSQLIKMGFILSLMVLMSMSILEVESYIQDLQIRIKYIDRSAELLMKEYKDLCRVEKEDVEFRLYVSNKRNLSDEERNEWARSPEVLKKQFKINNRKSQIKEELSYQSKVKFVINENILDAWDVIYFKEGKNVDNPRIKIISKELKIRKELSDSIYSWKPFNPNNLKS